MEWKMEWNSEHTQLQLTGVTGTAQSRLNYISHRRSFMSNCGMGVSNCCNGIWNGTVEWKMEWNGECS